MFAEMRLLPALLPEELDIYLANGWFRMRQAIFTTHFLCFNNQFYSALWLRARLAHIDQDKKWKELQKRNSRFTVRIRQAVLSREQEALYKLYKQGISFQASDNLHQLLLGYDVRNNFNTYEINVYDDQLLIGSGFFDLGKTSAAGIVSFYHPDYRRYSLGKYLIYQKMLFCQQQQLDYFYPGYVAPGYPLFDYKLSIGRNALEYFRISHRQWEPCTDAALAATPLQTMYQQLTLLQEQLKAYQLSTTVLFYRYFDARLDPYFSDYKLFDCPVFLYYYQVINKAVFRLVIFNVNTSRFQLVECSSISQMEYYEPGSHHIFSTDLLQSERVLHTADSVAEMVVQIRRQKTDR